MHLLILSKGLARYRYTFTEHLAAALAPAGHRITLAPLGEDLWEVDFPQLKTQSTQVRYLDFPQSWADLDQLRPDALCIMEYPPRMVKALLWAKHRRIPVIVATEIGAGLPQQKEVKLHTRLYHSLMAHLTDGQLACSPSARQPFGAPDRPIHFAPHSIDTTEFTVPESRFQTEPTRTQILTVAQYHPRKGLDLMAKALAPLKEKHSFQWRIIGILDPTWLKSVIQESDLQDHTVITGPIQGPDLIQEFQQAHLFVLPSRFDTYGVVTQEAAACGLPLLISQHAGSSHNLVTSQNGQVITPEDTAAFTAALDHQLTHKELWPAQSLASRQLAETWCVRQSATSTAQWLQAHFLKS